MPNLEYDDAEMLTMIAPSGAVVAHAVMTYKVVQTYLVRYAEAMAVADGGTAKTQYAQIQEHFEVKTRS